MSLERLHRARELATVALTLPPAERQEFLETQTQGDAELLAETQVLVNPHDSSDDATVEITQGPHRPIFGEEDFAGKKQIGNYRIIRRIGQGGMGMVYQAVLVAEDFQRQVALKLVKPSLASGQILRRFRMERQLLAALDHPNIARLLDAGSTEEGAPYLVMEYVEGLPLDRYVETKKLGIQDRLKLFLTICDAVQYAHQNLIVHRDIKPSNVLVSSEGVPKLLDFGIAKLMRSDETVEDEELKLTATDARPMSPHYASPEQARGENITTASDIYSLGVVLYQLLTGRLPYDFKVRTAAGIERTICETEPLPPSQVDYAATLPDPADKLRRRLRGDLDQILLTAMRKEPARRYASVHQFAEDIRRHLDGLPVIAQKDTLGYRVSKFVRRHTAGVAAATLAVFALLGSTIVSVYFARVANQERALAERRFEDTRQMALWFILDFDKKIRDSPTEARNALVDQALKYLQQLSAEVRGDDRLLRDVVRGYLAMGDVQGNPFLANLGRREQARASYQRALDLAGTASSPAVVKDELGQAWLKLGDLSAFEDKAAAARSYASAIPYLHGRELADAYQKQGFLEYQLARYTDALRSYQKALDLLRAEMVRNSDGALRITYAQLLQRTGATLHAREEYEAAIRVFEESLSTIEAVRKAGTVRRDFRRAQINVNISLGESLAKVRRYRDAESRYRTSLQLIDGLILSDAANEQFKLDRIIVLVRLVDLLREQPQRRKELADYTGQTLAELQPLVDRDDANAYALQSYVYILNHTPLPEFRLPQQVLLYARKWLARTGDKEPASLDGVAGAYFLNGDRAKAVEYAARALANLPPGEQASESRREYEANLRRFQTEPLPR